MPTIRSRIKQYIPDKLMNEMMSLCMNPVISDNNTKVDGMIALLRSYEVDFTELGPGTNRFAILIDNYVFKIALDTQGLQDNANEYALSEELQPFVIKTYELSSNRLLTVNEYVTVISREEFEEQEEIIREVLSKLSESYLLGDVGIHPKNFTNWGYRDNDDLVILDFAYIFLVQGSELLCPEDYVMLDYDNNFHNLVCPKCRRKYSFIDIRRKVSLEQENKEHAIAKESSYKLTTAVQEFNKDINRYSEADDLESNASSHTKPALLIQEEEIDMSKNDRYSEEDSMELYEQTMERMERSLRETPLEGDTNYDQILNPEAIAEQFPSMDFNTDDLEIVNIHRKTDTEEVDIRVVSTHHKDPSEVVKNASSYVDETLEKSTEVVKQEQDIIDAVSEEVTDVFDNILNADTEPTTYSFNTTIVDGTEPADVEEQEEETQETTNVSENDTDENDQDNNTEESGTDEVVEGQLVDHNHDTDSTLTIESVTNISDTLTIRNTVELKQSDDSEDPIETLRRQLEANMEAEDETAARANELADDYRHLEDDQEDTMRKQKRNYE